MSVTGAAAGVRAGWPVVVALGFGVFIGGFDQTFVIPVLTTMLGDLNVAIDELDQASWILNGYLLGYTVALPLMGRLADVHGHYRIFVVGMLIFMGGSVIVALAPNLAILTVARAVTALGGGALVPVGLAIASHSLPQSQRTMGIAAISTLDDASSLAGPLWGTLIGVWLGWRGLFWMNIVLPPCPSSSWCCSWRAGCRRRRGRTRRSTGRADCCSRWRWRRSRSRSPGPGTA